jgi:hypothetical protein
MSAEAAFQDALLTHIHADAGVMAVLGDPPRAYDRAPGGAAFPYLALGRGETTPVDADTPGLNDHRLTLHIWGRRDDRDAIRNAIGAVRQALHQVDLTLANPWRCVICRVVYADFFTAPDGRTLHGVVRVRALLDQQEI